MMPPFYHPTYHSDVSSVDDPSSLSEEDEESFGDFTRDDRNLIDLRSSDSNCYPDFQNNDSSYRKIHNNNNSLYRPSKRANVDDVSSSVAQEQVAVAMLQPSQSINAAGNSTTHATKGGQKLIGELFDVKNEVYMNAILREASREGFSKSLCFPNRSKWLQAKVPIWFRSGGILGR